DLVPRADARRRRSRCTKGRPEATVHRARPRQAVHLLEREHRVGGRVVVDGADSGKRIVIDAVEAVLEPPDGRALRPESERMELDPDEVAPVPADVAR